MPYPTPHQSFMDSIARWEGEWQAMPADSGNWVNCPEGRKLIGTMRGVTPAAFAQWGGFRACDLTADEMQEEVTLEVAAKIGMAGYYDEPGFDELEWSPLVWIAVDIGWGSGPVRAIKMLQELVGATVDGRIGPQTVAAYAKFIHEAPIGNACDDLSAARRAFYLRISEPGSTNAKFRKGWLRRSDYYTTFSAEWWSQWEGWMPSGGSGTTRPVDLGVEPRPGPELQANMVAAIQKALNPFAAALGIEPLDPDGILGPKTRAVMRLAGL